MKSFGLTEVLADTVARSLRENKLRVDATIANLKQRDAERQQEYVAIVSELRRIKLEHELWVTRQETVINQRLASLRHGERGEPGPQGAQGERGLQGLRGEIGERGEPGEMGPQGERGLQGLQGEIGPQGLQGVQGIPGVQGEKGDVGEKGERGEKGEKGDQGESGQQGEAGVRGESGPQGAPGERGEKGEAGIQGREGSVGPAGERGEVGPQGVPGERGERGERGASGLMTKAVAWKEGEVYYDGQIVVHNFGTYQALKDTAKHPDTATDWICLAAAGSNGVDGKDGRTFRICGTYDPQAEYQELDVVTLNATWFVAKQDNPGECPGAGWKSGPTGKKGERGDRGVPGPKGDSLTILEWTVNADYTITPILTDGSLGPALDIKPVLSRFIAEMN